MFLFLIVIDIIAISLGLRFHSLRVATQYIMASQYKFWQKPSMWIDPPYKNWVETKRSSFLLQKNNLCHRQDLDNMLLEESMRNMKSIAIVDIHNLTLQRTSVIGGNKCFRLLCSLKRLVWNVPHFELCTL